MRELTLEKIAHAVGGALYKYKLDTDENVTATSVVLDSRKAEQGGVFIATRGARVDGHSFIPQVWEQGVLCVITEENLQNSAFCPAGVRGNYIVVRDSFQALKDLATFYRSVMPLPIVGITGSVGKTSTKEMIASVLSVRYRVRKTEGNFNNEVGVPLTLFSLREEDEVGILEMGISTFGEMTRLTEMVRPDLCVITNIGPCHLEFLHDLDGVLRAKTEIFKARNPEGAVILNGNDTRLSAIADVDGTKPVFFGTKQENEKPDAALKDTELAVYATNLVSFGLEGTGCMIHTPKGDFPVRVPLPGVHTVENALAATAVGLALDMTLPEIRKGIENVEGMRGRLHLIHTENYLLLDDCYNANPKAVRSALDLLKNATGRKVAILGDMFELGAQSEEMHAEVGAYAAGMVDVLVCCGTLSEYMYKAAVAKEQRAYWFKSREEMLDALLGDAKILRDGILERGDNILIKASHGMGFDRVVEALQAQRS